MIILFVTTTDRSAFEATFSVAVRPPEFNCHLSDLFRCGFEDVVPRKKIFPVEIAFAALLASLLAFPQPIILATRWRPLRRTFGQQTEKKVIIFLISYPTDGPDRFDEHDEQFTGC